LTPEVILNNKYNFSFTFWRNTSLLQVPNIYCVRGRTA